MSRDGLMKAMRCIMDGVCETKDDCRAYGCPYADSDFDCMEDIIQDAYKELSKPQEEHRQTGVSFWAGKTVLVREVPVTIGREVYCTSEEPYAEGYDMAGHYYKLPIAGLRLLDFPVDGIFMKESERK
jgi:hypothetical protein